MTVKKLFAGVLPTSDTTVYTVPESKTTLVKSITLCNNSNADYSFNLLIGGRNGSGSNWLLNTKVIKAYDTFVIPCMDYAMADGAKIRLYSSGGSSIIVRISGEEIDGLIESTEYESYNVSLNQSSNILVPAVSYKRVIKSVFIGNASSVSSNISLSIGGNYLIMNKQIKNRDAILIPFMDQVLEAGESITGYKSNTSIVVPHITLKRVDD
ncbi:hypothetical protein [Paenibacillus taichungensis]|uniref:hypothetical protein n=1 Tax=Paenibacillus taichungensis TaxID=484184 RepID=UPI0028717043|nr:hypothetical protein [Paenibacillus taichungensis]MDR9744111.1 hypothetical protein [Paenibacillus taichungensis]